MKEYIISANCVKNSVLTFTIHAENKQEAIKKCKDFDYIDLDEDEQESEVTDYEVDETLEIPNYKELRR